MEVKTEDTLTKYEPYADLWMSAVPMNLYERNVSGRIATFRAAFARLAEVGHPLIIVELGTSRSFVDGAFPGCNSDNTSFWKPHEPKFWDHGAGCFTYLCAEYLKARRSDFEIFTVDLASSHIRRCKHMTAPFAKNIQYHVDDSVHFLENFGTKCDLVYIDTGDMTPLEPTAALQLREAQTLVRRNLLQPGGLVLIDDVRNPTGLQQGAALGKAKYSIPYLKEQGLVTLMDEYQVLMTDPR